MEIIYRNKNNGKTRTSEEFFNEFARMVDIYIYNPKNLNQFLEKMGFSLVDIFNMEPEKKDSVWDTFRDFGIQQVAEKVGNSETDWEPIEVNN